MNRKSRAFDGTFQLTPQTKAGLSPVWLVLPIGLILGLILSVPIVLGVRAAGE